MGARDHFLQAILEWPEDDALRLIFADWLEEHGDSARAEFIRVQCALANAPRSDPRRAALWEREHDLWYAHKSSWVGELPSLEGVGWDWFHRGFAGNIIVTDMEAFLRQAAVLFGAAPVRRVTLPRVSPEAVERLAAAPCLAQVAELDICYTPLHDAVIGQLVHSPFANGLRGLKFDGLGLTAAVVQSLADSPVLRRLEALALYGNRLGPTAAEVLAKVGPIPGLHKLDLGNNPVGDAARLLVAAPILAKVTYLDLVGCDVGDATIVALAASPSGGCLETLRLQSNDITDVGAMALAESSSWTALTELCLQGNYISPQGEQRLHERFGQRVHTAMQHRPETRTTPLS